MENKLLESLNNKNLELYAARRTITINPFYPYRCVILYST